MNEELIFSDGKTVYVTLESKIRPWVKWLLIALNLALYSIPILLLVSTPKEEVGKSIFAVFAMSAAFFWFLTRPTLWNIFGRECMVITKDNFSYYRDFGFYKTPVINTKIDYGIAAYIENELAYENEPYVVITFYEYLPNEEYKEILTTSIKTPEKNYETIWKLLEEAFETPINPYQFSAN